MYAGLLMIVALGGLPSGSETVDPFAEQALISAQPEMLPVGHVVEPEFVEHSGFLATEPNTGCCGGDPCCGQDECCDDECDDHHRCCCRSTCDMIPHLPYYPERHGYYYFRPYHYMHICKHQDLVRQWGGDPRNPYANGIFESIYQEQEMAARHGL